ncbi:12206_t:CDS:2 [Entrophospora sp. SA101]|nr:12206_t:CDS:2 [Entrophospora sp. SA101]
MSNGVVDLKYDRFLINEVDFDVLVVCSWLIPILKAPSQVVYHDRWVEAISVIEGVARGIIVFILEEIRMDIICRISGHSEGTYMEMIGRLIDITMCELPVEFKIDITR